MYGGSSKRELEGKNKETIHSPQKKKKIEEEYRRIRERKARAAKRLRRMTTREIWLMMGGRFMWRELQGVLVEYQDI